jgi:hypothetical protein
LVAWIVIHGGSLNQIVLWSTQTQWRGGSGVLTGNNLANQASGPSKVHLATRQGWGWAGAFSGGVFWVEKPTKLVNSVTSEI